MKSIHRLVLWVVFTVMMLVLLDIIYVGLATADQFTPEEMQEQISVLAKELDPEEPEENISQGVLIPPLDSTDDSTYTNPKESPARPSDRNVGLPRAGW